MNAQIEIIDALVKCAPPIIEEHSKERSRCILATAIGLEVLDYFGILAKEMPCEVTIFNQTARDWVRANCLGPAPSEGAILECIMNPPPEKSKHLKGWSGHLIILTKKKPVILIDLDMQQFNRPAKNISVPSAASLVWPEENQEVAGWETEETDHSVTICYRLKPGVKTYKKADWTKTRLQHKAKHIIGKIIREIKKIVEGGQNGKGS